MDQDILYKLGLNEEEIKIYLLLIKNGVYSVKQISDITSINRTTTYRFLESLEKKGLVEWVYDERGRKAKNTNLENISLYLKQKKQRIEEIEKQLPQVISDLSLFEAPKRMETQVRYYHGQKGIEQIIWNTLHTKEVVRSYSVFKRREFTSSKFEDELEQEWVIRKLKDKVITNETRLDYIINRLIPNYRETLAIKFISSKKFYITSDISIYNDTISIISFEKDDLIGVEIDNVEIAKTQKSIFDIIWDVAKPLKINVDVMGEI